MDVVSFGELLFNIIKAVNFVPDDNEDMFENEHFTVL